MHGLLQTEDYSRALIASVRATSADTAAARLANRMERQRRVLLCDDPPAVWFIVDQLSLYRLVGTPEVMADQMRHLAAIAAHAERHGPGPPRPSRTPPMPPGSRHGQRRVRRARGRRVRLHRRANRFVP